MYANESENKNVFAYYLKEKKRQPQLISAPFELTVRNDFFSLRKIDAVLFMSLLLICGLTDFGFNIFE